MGSTAYHNLSKRELRTQLKARDSQLEAKDKVIQSKEAQLKTRDQVIRMLNASIANLKRMLYGRRSERFIAPVEPPEQGELFPGMSTVDPPPVPPKPPAAPSAPKRKPRRRPCLTGLRVIEHVIEPEEDVSDGQRLSDKIRDGLVRIPAQAYCLRIIQRRYRLPDGSIVTAPPYPQLIPGGLADHSVLAQVVVDKYVDHLPLDRQCKRFARQGVHLPSSTIGEWPKAVAQALEPLYERLKQPVLESAYLQADETPYPVLHLEKTDSKHRRRSHRGYAWTYYAPESKVVVFDYRPGRGRDGPERMLATFKGALQTDGYSVYDHWDQVESVTTYHCWSHARRYFERAKQGRPKESDYVLTLIQELFAIDQRVHGRPASERWRARQAQAPAVLDALYAYLSENPGHRRSVWGKAVRYTLKRWEKLTRFMDDGRIELSTNLAENGLRPLVLGRKNYLFGGSHAAAQRSAMLYSLLGTCKLHGHNPYDWLLDVIHRLTYGDPDLDACLPNRWKPKPPAHFKRAA